MLDIVGAQTSDCKHRTNYSCRCDEQETSTMQPFQLILVSILILCCLTYAKPQPVFIGTSKSKNVKPVNSATDAAIALNSIHFMELLIGVKNSADVQTYTQSGNTPKANHEKSLKGVTTANASWTKLIPSILKQRLSIQDDSANITNDNTYIPCSQPTSEWRIPNPCPKHETVAEYTGQLWFLNKSGIRFRETIKIVSISPDGKSSALECNTEYHNGSKWVGCSKIICEFTSHTNDNSSGSLQKNKNEIGLKMSLDCELLVWLPLPNAATKGVRNKISSVFENVALQFLNANTQ